jgi:hypothetical protein
MKFKSTWVKYVLLAVLALGLGSLARTAQESETKEKSGKNMTVTGCLQKGDEAGEYSIKSEDGKLYELHPSASLDLSKHLGHKVTVTGSKMREKSEAKETGGAEAANLHVTNLKHISETCQ